VKAATPSCAERTDYDATDNSAGRVFGIPIGLDYSWFLIFALLTWTLAANYYPAEFQTWPTAQYWIVAR